MSNKTLLLCFYVLLNPLLKRSPLSRGSALLRSRLLIRPCASANGLPPLQHSSALLINELSGWGPCSTTGIATRPCAANILVLPPSPGELVFQTHVVLLACIPTCSPVNSTHFGINIRPGHQKSTALFLQLKVRWVCGLGFLLPQITLMTLSPHSGNGGRNTGEKGDPRPPPAALSLSNSSKIYIKKKVLTKGTQGCNLTRKTKTKNRNRWFSCFNHINLPKAVRFSPLSHFHDL